MGRPLSIDDEIVAALRRIIRGVDLHSRRLVQAVGLTWPQLAVLRAAMREGPLPVTALAKSVRLSQGTVTGILHRLERVGYVQKRPSEQDRRSTLIAVTKKGREVVESAPSLLQDKFGAELAKLKDWERHQTLAALQRIAEMMDLETLDASALLVSGPLVSTDSAEPAFSTQG